MDLFEEVPEADRVDLKNLVYMPTRDLNELASLLSSILLHQRTRYQ
jgi:hypothetical protein